MTKTIIGKLNEDVKITGKLQQEVKISSTLAKGGKGYSAYEIWLKEGNEGSVQDFLNDLGADKFYKHKQEIPSEIWEIPHNLEKYPTVVVVDSNEEVVYGNIKYIDKNNVKLSFVGEFSGKAYLN